MNKAAKRKTMTMKEINSQVIPTLVCQQCSLECEENNESVRVTGFAPCLKKTLCDECGDKYLVLAVHSNEPLLIRQLIAAKS